MKGLRIPALAVGAVMTLVITAVPASALPTMIRLGYADCASCHISPQGAGPLNAYGRGIDRAQSLRGGEYVPSTSKLAQKLSMGGRITQDLRMVMQLQRSWVPPGTSAGLFRPRLMYRNVTELNDAVRVSATIIGESENAPRPARSYDPIAQPSSFFLNTALVHYRAAPIVEFAGGRDQLPSGVNVPDLAIFVKSRERLGYYDAPVQVKMFWNAKRFHVTPFAYMPSGNEPVGDRESGVGTLAEVDVLGRQKTVVGATLRHGSALNGDRQTVGAYTRLGFGSWGILAEHEVTDRSRELPAIVSFRQSASFAQVFWAAREWLVASAVAERLRVQQPFAERLVAGKFELAARLSSQASVVFSTRLQHDAVTGRNARSVAVQAAFKTVQ